MHPKPAKPRDDLKTFSSAGAQRLHEGVAINAMLMTGIIHRVECRDRTADAAHPVLEEHTDRLGLRPHHIIDGIVKGNWHARLRSDRPITRQRPALFVR